MSVTRYHPLLVALHALLAVLLVAALAWGFLVVAPLANADPRKLDALQWHMAGGMLVLALMALRLVVRLRTARPPPASTGHAALDRLLPWVHLGFYALVGLLVATGYTTGLLAGLPDSVFARSGAPLPADFSVYPTRIAHGVLAWLLAALIGLHVAAAVYHQVVRKDRLLQRMSFGRR